MYPIVQLSRKSLVVPVFEAAWKGKFKTELGPKAGVRASLSDRIEEIKYACSGRITCSPVGGLYWYTTLPLKSTIWVIAVGGMRRPPLAKVAYAPVSSSKVTSPPPRVKDNP